MRSVIVLLLSSLPWFILTDAFTSLDLSKLIRKLELRDPSLQSRTRLQSSSTKLPTLEELSKDPFMKQVEHGFVLSNNMLTTDNFESLQDSIQAQLSHSEGIRGFMVSYLTSDQSPADQDEVPEPLRQALTAQMKSEAAKDIVSLTCMNVIMPTAMITMHEDEELSAGSARTAKRGIRILRTLKDYPAVVNNAKAILAVATDSEDKDEGLDASLMEYWSDFFEKWGYKDTQRVDIAKAMQELLQ